MAHCSTSRANRHPDSPLVLRPIGTRGSARSSTRVNPLPVEKDSLSCDLNVVGADNERHRKLGELQTMDGPKRRSASAKSGADIRAKSIRQRILLPRRNPSGQHYLGGHYAGVLRAARIELSNVSFWQGQERRVLDAVNFVGEPGSTTCVVATDQRDQSDLLAIMYGLYHPDNGQLLLDDVPLSQYGAHRFKERVSLVLQEPWMSRGSIAENICFGRRGVSPQRVEAVGAAVGLTELISGLPNGYETLISDPSDQLRQDTTSSFQPGLGHRRQIALARALLRNPGLILLEEPTTNLNAHDEQTLLSAIETACQGRTAVIATHRLNVARQADAVFVLENGSLDEYRSELATAPEDHQRKVWDLRIPPVVSPDPSAAHHLRVVDANDRRHPRPTTRQWGMTIGAELAPGYAATGLLGRTEQTDTWVAWCSTTDRPVRVRTPRYSPVSYKAFDELRREQEMLKAIHYAGAPALYDADLDADMPFIAVEYLDSPSLAQVAQQRGAGLDQLDVLYTGFELAHTLQIVHDLGYVHLTLRARKVRTRNETIVISDFGSIQPIGSVLGSQFGTYHGNLSRHSSTAPEQVPSKRADPRMDIYALGALMHRAAAGTVSTETTPTGAIRLAPFRSIAPDAPDSMCSTIDQMLDPDPSSRPDAKEVIRRFRQVLPRSLVQPRSSEIRPLARGLRLVTDN